MKQLLRFALLLAIMPSYVWAQDYFFIFETGTLPPYEYNETEDAYDIMGGGTPDNQLSTWQTLPFSWDFYGTPVNGYFASDNGYITFDANATTSDPNNANIPSASGPNMAIYAFWDDLVYGAAGKVRAFDYGVSPNRIHVVQWYGMERNGTGARIYSSLRLHEDGRFDIVFDLSQGGSAAVTDGTVGVESAGGTQGKALQSQPSTQFPDLVADNQDDFVYQWQFGNQRQYDLSVADVALKPSLPAGNYPLQGTIKNYGFSSVTSFRLNYQLNNDPVVQQNLNTLQLTANGGEFFFFASNNINLPSAGQFYTLKMWCDNLNGNTDQNNENDTLTMQIVTVLGVNAPKKVVVEEFTASWCGACPTGLAYMDTLYNNFPGQVIGVANHASDGFSFTNQMFDFYGVGGIPDGMVDRVGPAFGQEPLVYPTQWPTRMAARLNDPVPVQVEVYNTYNAATREVTGQIVSRFVDYAVGDLRMMLFVTEDSLPGNQTGIGPYVYDHILRAMPLGEWGVSGTIPATATPGNDYVEDFTLTLDPSWNIQKLNFIGAVVRYDINKRKHEIVNAGLSGIDNGVSATQPVEGIRSAIVSPNPSHGMTAVEVTFDKATEASFILKDAYGRTVQRVKEGKFSIGTHHVWFDSSRFPAGIYYLQVESSGGRLVQKVVVAH